MVLMSGSWLLVSVIFLAAQGAVHAQEANGQGKILWAMAKWLSGSDSAAPLAAMGWSDGGNPCNGWGGIGCNSQGYVTNINLAGKGLTGTIPSDPGLWNGLTGLTTLDLSNNQLTGSVPAAIKSAPLLNSVNLADNKALCGYLPTGLPANTGGTGIGVECGAAQSPSPSPSPSPPPSPSPATPSPSPALPSPSTNTTEADTPAAKPSASPAQDAAVPPAPAAPTTEISSAPICSCALRGFGSQDCAGALAKECRGANPPEVCENRTAVLNDTGAATALGQYLADSCFKGQNMNTSICTCVQNLLGNDCAKARVTLCVKGDPLCLPVQNVVGETGSPASAEDAQQVAAALDAGCEVADPGQEGVKATMEFPNISMGLYTSKQYTQNVANALSSVTDVPTSAISTLDVRPFTGAARAAAPKRLLLQSGSNGVQATYFLATEDPVSVSQRLSAAAKDGTLTSRLSQYGITAQAGGLRVQNYLQSAAPAPAQGSSFPLWALAPIIVGALALIGLLALLLFCCCFRKRKQGKKATASGPAHGKGKQLPASKTPVGRGGDDVAVARDMPGKGYDAPGTAYVSAGAGAAAAAAAAAANGGYKQSPTAGYASGSPAAAYSAGSPPSPSMYDSSPTGSGRFSKGPSTGTGAAVGAAAAVAATAAAGTAAAMKRSGSNRTPRPESPTSSKGSGSNVAPLGVSGTAAGAAAPPGPAHLASLQSMKVRDYDAATITRSGSGGSSTLTPWEGASRSGSSGLQPKVPAAASGVTGSSLRSAGTPPAAVGAAAGAAAGLGATAALAGARSGSLGPTSSVEGPAGQVAGGGSWKSNVRPASGQLAAAGAAAGSTMMANPAAKSTQQAERAKFWAQFQETWQQVRQTQNVDNEPGSPSSGTNWTDITDARTFRHQ